MNNCIFCKKIKEGSVNFETEDVVSFTPLNPVAKGHLLVVPVAHVEDFTQSPIVSARVMEVAAHISQEQKDINLITSKGKNSTQSIKHLHIHLVPRRKGDGLYLPWTKALYDKKKI